MLKLGIQVARRCRLAPIYSAPLRSYLSENYKCSKVWETRLQPDYMEKVDLDSLYYAIDQNFSELGKASVIDVDIYVNKSTDGTNSDEISDLLHKLRLTEETSNTLESTGHAVVRTFLENNQIDELLTVLDDRLNYGVFLDDYVASYLLDELIKRKDFVSAARVSACLMLQEDLDNELTRNLALYACYNYLSDPAPFYPVPEVEEGENVKKKEEIKVRVKFIRNEFFDDHFDLRNHNHLVGKTLSMIGVNMQPAAIGQNAQLIGEALYEKYDKALSTLTSAKNNLYKDVVTTIVQHLEKIPDDKLNESGIQLRTQLQELLANGTLNQTKYADDVEKLIKDCLTKCESDVIAKQEERYKDWMKIREEKLYEELDRLQRSQRLLEVEKLTGAMKTEEEKLWFFENEDKIDLLIDSKKVFYPKKWFGKKKKPRSIDEGYVPPEIRQRK